MHCRLNEKQKTLPELEDMDEALARADKEIEIKRWEMEVAVTRQKLAETQLVRACTRRSGCRRGRRVLCSCAGALVR